MNQRAENVSSLLVTNNVILSWLNISTLMIEETETSETSVLTRPTRRHIPEYGILHSDRHENLKSYVF
jgi:hypothetical protein